MSDKPRRLKFWGASDDLFECEGTVGGEPDEVGCFDSSTTVRIKHTSGAGLHVTGLYAPDGCAGCWMIGITQLDEDMPLPIWPMHWHAPAGRGYSVMLTIDVPAGTTVELIQDGNVIAQ